MAVFEEKKQITSLNGKTIQLHGYIKPLTIDNLLETTVCSIFRRNTGKMSRALVGNVATHMGTTYNYPVIIRKTI